MWTVLVGCLLATALSFLTFSPWVKLPINFWLASTIGMGLLGAYAWYAVRPERSRLVWFENRSMISGILSAVLLYAVSFGGVKLLASLSPALQADVAALYAYGNGTSRILIGTLLLFWLAPLEELFWRGFVQNRLMQRFGSTAGWLASVALYVLAHIWAGNIALWLALAVAGLCWGWLFKRYGSVWPGIISHAVWDVLVFIILPLKIH